MKLEALRRSFNQIRNQFGIKSTGDVQSAEARGQGACARGWWRMRRHQRQCPQLVRQRACMGQQRVALQRVAGLQRVPLRSLGRWHGPEVGPVGALHATSARQVRWEAGRARGVTKLRVVWVSKPSTPAYSGSALTGPCHSKAKQPRPACCG